MSETISETAQEQGGDDLRSILESAFSGDTPADSAVEGRDAQGRFAGTDDASEDAPAPTEESADKPTTTTEEPEAPAISPPQAWSAPDKEIFNSLPREAQDAVLRREREVERGFQERAKPLKEYDAIQEVLAPFAANYRVQGYTDVDAVRMWATVATELRKDPANAIRELTKSHGLTPEQIFGFEGPVGQTQPQEHALAREVAEVKRALAQRQEQDNANAAASTVNSIERFAADPAHPHFEAVRVEMGALMAAGIVADMQSAYDRAVYANPDVRTKVVAAERAEAESKRVEDAKKAADAARRASVSVRGAPPVGNGGSVSGIGSLRDDIAAAYAAHR